MRVADFFRCTHSPRSLITFSLQVSENILKSSLDVSFDILEEAVAGSHDGDAFEDPREEMSWIFLPSSESGFAEWLAGISAREDVHQATKV
jgi:hypothetical protein